MMRATSTNETNARMANNLPDSSAPLQIADSGGSPLSGALGRGELGCGCSVLGRIDVEEGVHRIDRPGRHGDAMAPRPHLDLAQILIDQRAAQIAAQRHRPQAGHRMPPFARARAGKWDLRGVARMM